MEDTLAEEKTEGEKFIGFDLGAESGRCVVSVLSNNKITLHEVHRFTTHNVQYEGGFYWDILAIYKELITGLTNACRQFGNSFNGIGIDTWGVDSVLIDPDGRILGYPYHYRDDRTDGMMEQAFKIVPKEEIYKKVGIQFAQFNTLYQLLSENKRSLNMVNLADKMLLIPDFLSFLLSGKKIAEFTNASTTSLVDPYTRNWDWELIDKFNLPRNIFPEIVEPGTILGPLLPSIASKTGLDKGIPVIASASHDTASAVISAPASGDSWAFLSCGTWSLMGVELKQPRLTSQAMEANFTNEGGYENTTRFLKNIIGLWPIQECRRYWLEKSGEYSYAELASLALKNGEAGAWVDLDDPRFLKAGEMPEKIIAYLQETGQVAKNEPGYIIRVILESLAFSYKNTIKEIEAVTGLKITKLHAVGGGIQNELLIQLTADAVGIDVFAGPVEGTIIGNTGVMAIASGKISDLSAWRKVVADSFGLKAYRPEGKSYFDGNEIKYKSILRNV